MDLTIKHIYGYRSWSGIFLILFMLLAITACGRYAKAPRVILPEPEPEKPATLREIQFTIQVGAFSTDDRAAAYADQLQAAGLDAYYFVDVDNLYKVRLERFDNRESALERALELQTRSLIDAFIIVHPRPEGIYEDPSLAIGVDIVKTARRFIGIAYRWGGTSPEKGFDCSGLTMTVYRLNGLDLPRTAREQFRTGRPVSRKTLRPGDLVFFSTDGTRRITHVGIYSGKGQFIHAPSKGNSIRTAALSNSYFSSRYQGARRYF